MCNNTPKHPSRNELAMPTRCVFCGSDDPLTSEHIWGDWILKGGYLARTANKYKSAVTTIAHQNRFLDEHGALRTRSGDVLGANIRIVCAKCNNGWMSRIQERAKPYLVRLFDGSRSIYDSKCKNYVSAWAALASMTSEYLDCDPSLIAISQTDRNYVRSTESAPLNWRIWVGFYNRQLGSQCIKMTLPVLDSNDTTNIKAGNVRLPNTQTTTIIIGRLYIHAMSCFFHRQAREWNWPVDPRARTLLTPIWPATNNLLQWPTQSLTTRDAQNFSTSFGDFQIHFRSKR